MWHRSLRAAIGCACLFAQSQSSSAAADIFAQLFPLTGEVRLVNRNAAPLPIVYYSITSASGALNPASSVWNSITENYDAPSGSTPGNGLIDPTGQWQKLSATSTELTEALFTGLGGNLPPTRAISLGYIWNPTAVPFPDLVFDLQNDLTPIAVTIELAIDGDYSGNQTVDLADYAIWRRYFGSTSMLLADGNLNGVIDEADYLMWQASFGMTVPPPPYIAGNGSLELSSLGFAVPEPSSIASVLIAFCWLCRASRKRPAART